MRVGGIEVLRASSLYDTEPVGFRDQGRFLNLVAEAAWRGSPRDLLECCLETERSLGRERGIPNGPRTLDIDILAWGGRVHREVGLEIPHPRLHRRRFVLVPLAELAPGFLHPVLGMTVAELLACCPDRSSVRTLAPPPTLERGGPSGYNPAASRGKTS